MTTNNALKDGLILVSEASSQDSDRLNQTKDISQNLTDQKIRVLIVDDLRLVCEGLQAIFAEDHDIEIIGYALNGQDAINKISQVQLDVVVLDLVMPVMGGIETTKLISHQFPDVKILILSASEEDSAVLETITAGADGYVLKSMIISDLSLAIRSVHSGSSHFAAGLINKVAKIATTNLNTQVVPQTSSPVVTLKRLYIAWTNPAFRPTALKVALVVGSILFTINHGSAVLRGEMTRERWFMGLFTYMVPYSVSMHGQHSSRSRHRINSSPLNPDRGCQRKFL
jgi:DNA-binding NarL/FixJ family response regulator